AYRLTGKTVTSHDLALFTWCMNNQDVNNIHWDESLIKKTKIDGDKLPDLQPAIHNVGNLLPEIAEELGLSPETKVILGAGDLASAAIGSGGVLDYQPHVCIGTSSWLLCHYERRKIDIFHMIGASTCAIPGRYMVMAEQETAGVNLTWIRDKVLYHKDELLVNEKVPDVYKIFDKLVEETEPGEHKLIFTPWMFGERTPIEDYTVRGSLNNLSLDIDRRHIIRAIFEGVAFNTKWLLKYEEKLVGRTLDDINMVGGGAMSDIWCQIYADILDRTMRQVMNPKEATSMGAAFIASVSLGYIKWEDIPNLVEIKKVFKPRSEYREIYDELYKEFLNIYKNNKKMYARLNKL
ncbi:MAG: xylulose kinase, partial [archaeon]|nr:xylulose kinase [archaeon]